MADDRTYIKLHDGMPDHPKVDGLSDKAFRLLIETWCWCSRHLTDGRVPLATWTRRGSPKTRAELVSAGLADVHSDHVVMHDYLVHQRSAAEVAAIKAARSAAGTVANHRRWHEATGRVDPNCPLCCDPKSDPKSDPVWDPKRVRSGSTETETETEEEKTDPSGPSTAPQAPPRARASRLPEDFAVTEAMVLWAQENAPHVNGKRESEAFADYWRGKAGKDALKVDWTATWRNWMRRAEQQSGRNGAPRNGQSTAEVRIAAVQALKTGPSRSPGITTGPSAPRALPGATA